MNDLPYKRTLSLDGNERYDFAHVSLTFSDGSYENVFATKNNKTLRQTLEHHRYANLTSLMVPKFIANLEMPLGTFVQKLKHDGDSLYRRFLNKYGDSEYSIFLISDKQYWDAKGVYAYYLEDELKYIGRCKDSMKKRVN